MPTIISNYANDLIEYKNNKVIDGGPALFIEKYYVNNNINYDLIDGNTKGEVLILNNNGNDVGLITFAPEIEIEKNIESDFFIISTLLDEFCLKNTYKLKGLIFCDIQGYIREINSPKRLLVNAIEGIENVDYLKIADYEFQYLTSNFVSNYINSGGTILITTGSKGIVKIINKNGEEIINVAIGNFKDTLGAGDTFLASFADNYFRNKDLYKSVKKASNYVYTFLENKNINN